MFYGKYPQSAEDKCRKVILLGKSSFKLFSTEKRIVLHKFNCNVGKIHVNFCFAFLFALLGSENGCPLLTVEWKISDRIIWLRLACWS